MEKVTVEVGTIIGMRNGATQDNRRPVEFVAEKLADTSSYLDAGSDTRGVRETLYKTEDGRLVVYIEEWSHWQGEPNFYHLREVTEADLDVNGRFEFLGREAGLGRPLTLDEAIQPLE